MRKILFPFCLLLTALTAHAGGGDDFLTLNAGFLFNSTLNASVGLEHELAYSDAVELFGEIGGRWRRDASDGKTTFRNGYYWGGGVLYKKQVRRFKNSMLRLRFGPECGAHTGKYFLALEGGLEYNVILPGRVQLSIIQKNQVGFFHGDTFRNGLLVAVKIPF